MEASVREGKERRVEKVNEWGGEKRKRGSDDAARRVSGGVTEREAQLRQGEEDKGGETVREGEEKEEDRRGPTFWQVGKNRRGRTEDRRKSR